MHAALTHTHTHTHTYIFIIDNLDLLMCSKQFPPLSCRQSVYLCNMSALSKLQAAYLIFRCLMSTDVVVQWNNSISLNPLSTGNSSDCGMSSLNAGGGSINIKYIQNYIICKKRISYFICKMLPINVHTVVESHLVVCFKAGGLFRQLVVTPSFTSQ